MTERLSTKDRALQEAGLIAYRIKTEGDNFGRRASAAEKNAGVTERFVDYIVALSPYAGFSNPDAHIEYRRIESDPDDPSALPISPGAPKPKLEVDTYSPYFNVKYQVSSSRARLSPAELALVPRAEEFVGMSQIVRELAGEDAIIDGPKYLSHDRFIAKLLPLGEDERFTVEEMDTIDQILKDEVLLDVVSEGQERLLEGEYGGYLRARRQYGDDRAVDARNTAVWIERKTADFFSRLHDADVGHLFTVREQVKVPDNVATAFPFAFTSEIAVFLNTQNGKVVSVPTREKRIKVLGREVIHDFEAFTELNPEAHIALLPAILKTMTARVPQQFRISL